MADAHRETYTVSPCPCGHRLCGNWHVEPVAAVQGVGFTEEQARAVARLLNEMEKSLPSNADLTVATWWPIWSEEERRAWRIEHSVELDFERLQARVILQLFMRSAGHDVRNVLDAPCVNCGYSGSGYWQAGTHGVGCPWHSIGGVWERLKVLEMAMEKARG